MRATYTATELVSELLRQGTLRAGRLDELAALASELDGVPEREPDGTHTRYERALCRFFSRLAETTARGYPRLPPI